MADGAEPVKQDRRQLVVPPEQDSWDQGNHSNGKPSGALLKGCS